MFGMFRQVRDLTEPRAQNPRVELTFVPRAFSTQMRETLDVFLDLTVPEIIEQCLQRCGLSPDEHYDIGGLTTEYEPREYVVQYKETDLRFISRLCEHHGIFFFVDHSSGKDVLVFGDGNDAFPALERTPQIPFRPVQAAGGTFEDRVCTVDIITKALPKRYTVRDYNYRIPGVDLLASADVVLAGFPFPLDLVARAPRLRWVHSLNAGASNFRQPFAGATADLWGSDVALTTARGANGSLPIAEFVLASILLWGKNLPQGFPFDDWSHEDDRSLHRWPFGRLWVRLVPPISAAVD